MRSEKEGEWREVGVEERKEGEKTEKERRIPSLKAKEKPESLE